MKTQHEEILQILKATRGGVNSFEWRTRFIQLPVRIKELKDMGYHIVSKRNRDMSVNYIYMGNSVPVVPPKPPQLHEMNQATADRLVKVIKGNRIYWEEPKEPEQLYENL